MDLVERLLENPDETMALAYGTAMLTGTVYAAYRNDFGASGKTTIELENYLDEAETGLRNPLQSYKAWEYSKELETREEEENTVPDIDEEFLYAEESNPGASPAD